MVGKFLRYAIASLLVATMLVFSTFTVPKAQAFVNTFVLKTATGGQYYPICNNHDGDAYCCFGNISWNGTDMTAYWSDGGFLSTGCRTGRGAGATLTAVRDQSGRVAYNWLSGIGQIP